MEIDQHAENSCFSWSNHDFKEVYIKHLIHTLCNFANFRTNNQNQHKRDSTPLEFGQEFDFPVKHENWVQKIKQIE